MMQQDESPSKVLHYASPVISRRPRRWWILIAFASVLFLANLQPRVTPPGWPTKGDHLLMLLIPVGAVVMAVATSLPGSVIGLYGAFGVLTFVPAQLSDTRLGLRLDDSAAVHLTILIWCSAVMLAWIFCRLCALFRE